MIIKGDMIHLFLRNSTNDASNGMRRRPEWRVRYNLEGAIMA